MLSVLCEFDVALGKIEKKRVLTRSLIQSAVVTDQGDHHKQLQMVGGLNPFTGTALFEEGNHYHTKL